MFLVVGYGGWERRLLIKGNIHVRPVSQVAVDRQLIPPPEEIAVPDPQEQEGDDADGPRGEEPTGDTPGLPDTGGDSGNDGQAPAPVPGIPEDTAPVVDGDTGTGTPDETVTVPPDTAPDEGGNSGTQPPDSTDGTQTGSGTQESIPSGNETGTEGDHDLQAPSDSGNAPADTGRDANGSDTTQPAPSVEATSTDTAGTTGDTP